MRVPAPTTDEVVKTLQIIAQSEKVELPAALAQNISNLARRNLRRAIMMLQTCHLKNAGRNLTSSTYVPCPEYESFTKEIAKDVMAE